MHWGPVARCRMCHRPLLPHELPGARHRQILLSASSVMSDPARRIEPGTNSLPARWSIAASSSSPREAEAQAGHFWSSSSPVVPSPQHGLESHGAALASDATAPPSVHCAASRHEGHTAQPAHEAGTEAMLGQPAAAAVNGAAPRREGCTESLAPTGPAAADALNLSSIASAEASTNELVTRGELEAAIDPRGAGACQATLLTGCILHCNACLSEPVERISRDGSELATCSRTCYGTCAALTLPKRCRGTRRAGSSPGCAAGH